MNAADLLREFAYPARNATVLLSGLCIFLLLEFAAFGKLLGLFLMFLVLPSLLHYLMRLLDARARGAEPGPLEVDDLTWYHAPWRLFMIVHVAVVGYVLHVAASRYGLAALLVSAVLLAMVVPASLAVLAITRSPLDALNPRAVGGVIARTGETYWMLPVFVLGASLLLRWLELLGWSDFIVEFAAFYLLLVFFSLTGAIVQPYELYDEVDIHDPVEPDQHRVDEGLLKARNNVLDHAYGFISRDNRQGGFRHIEGWLREDPDPETAWAWFFDRMLRWENKTPALFFAQSYLSELLGNGDARTAVKVMMRCRLHDDSFVPLAADIPLAIEAADAAGNQQLADFLRARV